jgi:hypothetical protein
MPSPKITTAPVLHVLSAAEIENPMLPVHDFFDRTDLQDARELLWGWLKATVTGNFNKTLNARERALILEFYENTERLIEAAYVLRQSASPAP